MRATGISRAVLVAAVSIVGSGCASLNYSASANRGELVNTLPFRAQRPIAREVRYTFVSATVLSGDPGAPIVAVDSVTRAQLPRGRQVVSLAAQGAPQQSSGTKWSDIYGQRAAEAQRAGRTADFQRFTALSQANLQTEVAMSQMVTGASGVFAIYAGATQALRAVGQAIIDGSAVAMRDWITTNTGAIGPEAPEGSVLNLQLFAILTGRKFKREILMEYVAVATLDDGRGRTLQSTQGWQLWGHKATGSALQVPSDATRYDKANVVPSDKKPLLKPVESKAWAPHVLLAANAAVADLYSRLEALSAPNSK